MNLVGCLSQQEQTTEGQYQIAPGNVLSQHAEPGLDQPDNPGQREQQGQPSQHGKANTQPARQFTLLRRQAAYQNRNENDVIDAEHYFERQQGRQRYPGFGQEDPVKHGKGVLREKRSS